MKTIVIALAACVSIGGSAVAGHAVRDYKADKNPPGACFAETELQLDLFGLYGWSTEGSSGDGFGGGIGVNYFFQRYFGIGVDGAVRDASNHGSRESALWNASASLIGRFPLELGGGLCLAPYILGGGGVQANGTTHGSFHAGGGLEWRATPMLGVFTEGRYIWAGHEDQVQVRLGARIVF